MYMMKRRGPGIESWGTPVLIVCVVEEISPIWTKIGLKQGEIMFFLRTYNVKTKKCLVHIY